MATSAVKKPVSVPLPNMMGSSTGRPRALIDWVLDQIDKRTPDDIVGPIFWQTVRDYWSTFDLIEHDYFCVAFGRYRPYWQPQPEIAELPEKIRVWRGGDRYRVRKGLSWTTDRAVAEKFAVGHRFIFNKYPTLVTAVIDRSEVILVSQDRRESEIVVRGPLLKRAERVPFVPARDL